MAVMVEGASKRKTRKGKDFVVVDFSDQSGNFSASCFEESLVESFIGWAREQTCVLLSVELDSPSADEPPRVTVRGGRPLSDVREEARMALTLDISNVSAIQELALLLRAGTKGGGEVIATLDLGKGVTQKVLLGRDFALDGDFVDGLAAIDGLSNLSLRPKRSERHLRLVA